MPSLLDIRRRIRSVKSTQQITKAMKMVSAAKLRRAQERVFSARPYAGLLRQMLVNLVTRLLADAGAGQQEETPLHPLLARRPTERVLLLVFSGDRGLAGAFNTNIIKAAQAFLEEHARGPTSAEASRLAGTPCAGAGRQQVTLIPIGRKGRDFFRRRRPLEAEYVGIFSRLNYEHARQISTEVIRRYTSGEADAVFVIYNEFKSVLSQRLVTERLLPLEPIPPASSSAKRALDSAPGEALVDYIYEQPPQELFATLLPRYVEVEVFRALLESAAAEHAARMTAMDSATNNAAEMIDRLTLNMNRIRQASITREIIEIVSGAAALG